jgi:predicted SPOUT superfamily RNA methylase MTH1
MLRGPIISIAIPDSLFCDENTLRGKTAKVGQIARAAAIFGVERIYIYRDASRNFDRDYETAKEIFEYMETPQYLRRRLIRRKSELESAGILPPLKIPHHLKESKVVQDEIREAVLFLQNGKLVADVGTSQPADFDGHGQPGQRVTVQIVSTRPLSAKIAKPPRGVYWGFEVRRAPSLARFLRSSNFQLLIFTSRLGESLAVKRAELETKSKVAERALLCFGSPDAGVDFMLTQDHATISDFPNALYLNFFPYQKVATIRLEEAIIGCLSIINFLSSTQ